MGAGSGDARCTNCGDIGELPAGGPEQPECEHKDVAPICDRHGEVIARECQDCGKRSFILHGLCRDELLLGGGKYFGPKVPGVVVPTEDGAQADVGATVDGA